jgi:sulfate adenylyltransferase (ADP) / ATP adenylyltransferase
MARLLLGMNYLKVMGHHDALSNDASELQLELLWPRIRLQTQYALECGALQPISTTYDWIEQNGIQFLVRVLANLQRKVKATEARPKNFNPFLPYDSNLFVADLSPTHLVLLNKFNVMDHHLLIVTRAFESQDSLLTDSDFQALALGLSEIDGLAFYNGGKVAGASQPHKHLQIVPLPFVPDGSRLPLDELMLETLSEESIGVHSQLPYRHAIARLDTLNFTQPLTLVESLRSLYLQLMGHLNLISSESAIEPLGAYNLLVTRQWMCVVPRSQDSFANIPVNALGFSGALLVRNTEQLEHLKQIGPMTVLTEVGYAT